MGKRRSGRRGGKALGIIPDEEWDKFVECVKSDLPSAFRITANREFAEDLRDRLVKDFFSRVAPGDVEGENIGVPEPIEFVPDRFAWRYSASRVQIRRSPEFSKLHKFLVAENEVGNICRQEVVSMIPPLLLDVQPEHFVLDMCAAPGSKTSQIVEMIHSKCQSEATKLPQGLVVANDVDNKRSYLLVHQMKRLQSPCLVVTNHDATCFPNLFLKTALGDEKIQYDRILADVPCSGDGTIRKNATVWRQWDHSGPLGLHDVQRRILARAVQMLKVGGRIVYSTCSLHPVEDEAVIAQALREFKGQLKLVDVSEQLPSLKRCKGITEWIVSDRKEDIFYESYDKVPEEQKKQFKESFFPPTTEEVEWMNLDRCMRILPHHQNTGGFFVAVLEKTGDVDHEEVSAQRESNYAGTFKESPFIFLPRESNELYELYSHYKLSEDFPQDQFMVRSENEKHKTLYFVSKSVKQLLESKRNEDIKFINSGVKGFSRSQLSYSATDPTVCSMRLHQEILPLLAPFLTEDRVIDIKKDDFLISLRDEFPRFEDFSDEAKEKLLSMSYGGCLLRYTPEKDDTLKVPIMISVWRAKTSVNVLLCTKERYSWLIKLVGVEEANEIIEKRKVGLQKHQAMREEQHLNKASEEELDEAEDQEEEEER